MSIAKKWLIGCLAACVGCGSAFGETIKIGLNYPQTGPYSVQGLDQLRAAEMAVEEINAEGGILGQQVALVIRDSKSNVATTEANVTEMLDEEGVKMIFGGSSSTVAFKAGSLCQEAGIPFFATLTYSTATTGTEARRFMFRECYNAWMGAKAISAYLKERFSGKSYFYITADYTWGHTTESAMRKFTGTEDTSVHKGIKTPFPGATEADFRKSIAFAKMVKPDVLVLILFGKQMEMAIRQATALGLKANMQIVVPNLTLGMAEGGGAKVMEGVIGALPWCWRVPYQYDYAKGKDFVEKYARRYGRYPSTSGASAYTIMQEYKEAAERAGTLEGTAIVKALENHEYQQLKDTQTWRAFDHQSVQTVYAVKCKAEADVLRDKYKLDYFEVLSSIPGNEAARTKEEWESVRETAGKPLTLEKLAGE